jgi:PAS domain S-box-containing protein
MTTIQQIENTEQPTTSQDLIVGLSLSEEVIQFNKESEEVTSYMREEVLHKKLDEILIPKDSIEEWKKFIESIRQTMWVDNVILPLKTKLNQPCMIRWTGFLVKDEQGSIKDICIFGKPLEKDGSKKQPSLSLSHSDATDLKEQEIRFTEATPILSPQKTEQPLRHGRNKIKFAREKTVEKEPDNSRLPEERDSISFFKDKTPELKSDTPKLQEQIIKPLLTMGKILEKTSQKLDLMNESLKELTLKYETVTKRLGDLEKKSMQLEKRHKKSNTDQPLSNDKETQLEPTENDTNLRTISSEDKEPNDKRHTFFSDPFGFKRQSKELKTQKQQLETRTKELDALQAELLKEQNTFNTRVKEFSKWREKLELLESAIETRRQELMQQEDVLLGKISPGATEKIVSNEHQPAGNPESAILDNDETLDKIPQSAAIIQRGILKQINNPFLELLGYPPEEIVEKSFFDFIAVEGLADIEKYYLDRLKGDTVSMYKTIFATKDNHKISVEVDVKQTIYNGEKAEIAIITRVDSPSLG